MNSTLRGHLCIVFALEHYNPLGMIRGLGENGVCPVYISIRHRGEVATKSRFISRLHRADTVEDGYRLLLREYGHFDRDHRPILFFSDDKTMDYFDAHYDEVKDKFILYNARTPGRIHQFMDKYAILQLAKKHGLNVLDTHMVRLGEIPEGLTYPVITKDISPNSGSWKADVFICEDEAALKKACEKISSPVIILQQFLEKKDELALEGYAIRHGREIQIITATSAKYLIKGYYSPYNDVLPFHNPDMERKIQAMFEEIGFEGVFEVEFLIAQDGTPYFSEINFRASAWNHTTNFAGMAESYLWAKGMLNGHIDESDRRDFAPFTSMVEIIDYGKRVDSGKITLAQWLSDFKQAKCTYYYNENDMGPWEYVSDKWDSYK